MDKEKQKTSEKEIGFWEAVKEEFSKVGQGIAWFIRKVWNIVVAIVDLVFKIIKTLITALLGIVGVISIILIATGIFLFCVSKSVGLPESQEFQKYREKQLSNYFSKRDPDKVPLLEVVK